MSIGTPTTRDTEMMEKTLTRARHALAQGSVGIAALLLWDTQILALAHNAYNETGDLTALYEDGQEDLQVARHLPLQRLNPLLIRGPIELVPGVKREEGRALLALMGKTSAENYGTPLP